MGATNYIFLNYEPVLFHEETAAWIIIKCVYSTKNMAKFFRLRRMTMNDYTYFEYWTVK